jgi:hypothetical protein
VILPRAAGRAAGTSTSPTTAPPLSDPGDPSDPAITHWQFGYLPQGMAAYGGGADNSGGKGLNAGTVTAYDSSGFRLMLDGIATPTVGTYAGAPATKIPATVAGATQAFWWGYPDGRNTVEESEGAYAMLDWRLPSGQWLEIIATDVGDRAGWEAQTLQTAAHVIRQDRPVPLPIRLTGVPAGYTFIGGWVTRDHGETFSQLTFSVNPDQSSAYTVQIVAFKPGTTTMALAVPPQNENSCADSNGLTVCVSSPKPEPAGLADAGGTKGLLARVTSLGNNPANWTTDVIR